MTYDEQKKRWEETWDEFVKQHCFGNKKVHLAPADLNDPNARPEYPSLYTVIFERQEQQFSVATLMKASKSIPNRGLELTLHSFASALQKVGDRKAQERCWRQAAPFIRPLSKKELSEVEGISIENWIAAFRHKGGPAIKSAKQTVGKSLEEYCDLSKDMSGIYAKGSNHGYLLGKKDEEKGSKYFAHAIRFDETEIETKTRLQRDGWHLLNYQPWNPWRGGDVLYLPNDVVTPKKRDSIPKGFYFLSSIQNGTGVNLAGCFGDNVPQAIPLGLLCEAGLCRQH